jgi:hypothetical protein
MTRNLLAYAEQCADERLALQLSDDVLSYAELEDELDEVELKFIREGGIDYE